MSDLTNEEITDEVMDCIKECINEKFPIPRYFILKYNEEDEEKVSTSPHLYKYRFLYHLGEALMEKGVEETLKFLDDIDKLSDDRYSIVVVIKPCGCVNYLTMNKEDFEKLVKIIKEDIE